LIPAREDGRLHLISPGRRSPLPGCSASPARFGAGPAVLRPDLLWQVGVRFSPPTGKFELTPPRRWSVY
jgi:hypothetical protein